MRGVKIFKVEEILNDLDDCINNDKPFSLIRFGDGGIKLIHSYFHGDNEQLESIIIREGLPDKNKICDILNLWSRFANEANYIDNPDVYFNGKFWRRYKKGTKPITFRTLKRLKMWNKLYKEVGIRNKNYCNPEFNYLSCIRMNGKRNILDLMKGKKIACITTRTELNERLEKYTGMYVKIVKIVGHYQDHYGTSFKDVISCIENKATNYDLWLISAGELGRIYTGLIKNLGGRAVDIGFVTDYWCTRDYHPRLKRFIEPNPDNKMEFILTRFGKMYEEFI